MSQLLTLTQREIADRRPLLWGTLVAALLPLAVRVFPGIRPEQARAFHEGLAAIFAVVFPAGLALGLGASVMGEDIAQRRLGFYFSRPISGWSIWASKMLAATFMTLGAWVCLVLPAFLLSRQRGPIVLPEAEWFLPWTGSLLVAILVAQAAAGAYRARDGLFAIDIAAFSVFVALAAAQVWQLVAAGAMSTPFRMIVPAIALIVVAAAVGGAAQVIAGRTDPRRGHLVLSSCLWGLLFAGLLVGLGFSAWVLSVKPDQVGVASGRVLTTPSASHVAFGAGRERAGYRPYFLLDTATGGSQRLPWWSRLRGFEFSEDGRAAVWIEGGSTHTLVATHLDGSVPPRRSALDRYADALLARISPDGRLAAIALPDRVAVVETDSGREVAAASASRLSADPRSLAFASRFEFVGDALVTFVRASTSEASLAISTFEFRTGTVRRGPVEGRQRTAFVAIADGSIVREEPGLLPAARPGWNQDQTLPAGSPGARLFVGTHGELVRIDPETGRREAVLVPPIPGGGKPEW